MGKHLGDVLANLIMVFDAPVVIGGGIAKAHDLLSCHVGGNEI